MSPFSSRFSPCTAVLLTPLCRSGVACRMGQSEEERGQGQARQRILVDEPHNYQVYHVHGFAVHVSTILRCPLSPTASCTLLQVKAPKGKPHAPHVVQDVRNKKDGFLKYKKVFCAFCALYLFPFSLPLELPLNVCYAFCAFSALCALPLVLPLGLPPCVLHVLHVLQIPRDRLWTWIQDEGTTESSDAEESEEESEEEAEEAEEEVEKEEEGSDAADLKDEDEPSIAQRAPRSTHLEVARMAAQAKGTPVKAKPEAKPEPEELSNKKKEKAKSPPKKKSKGKQKVEEKPTHVRYAVEGEPHMTMPTGATRGEKYRAGAAYDNDVQAMQRTLESKYEYHSDEYANTTKCVWPRKHKGAPNRAWRCFW